MSYLKFEKAQMANLQESMHREVLRTNRSGAYACRTVVDCNTRKYHGLLVAPIPEIDEDNHVLLSSLDATVVQHGAEFNLGVHKYQSGVFSPNGHKYIREFSLETIPTTLYRVGGVILKRKSSSRRTIHVCWYVTPWWTVIVPRYCASSHSLPSAV